MRCPEFSQWEKSYSAHRIVVRADNTKQLLCVFVKDRKVVIWLLTDCVWDVDLTTFPVAVSASPYPRTLTRTADKDKNATLGIRHSEQRAGEKTTDSILSIHTGYISQHPRICFFITEYFCEQFSLLTHGDSLQAKREPLHPNQPAERTSAHWHYSHTFLEHFFQFPLLCTVVCMCIWSLWLFPPARRRANLRTAAEAHRGTESLPGRARNWAFPLLLFEVFRLLQQFFE